MPIDAAARQRTLRNATAKSELGAALLWPVSEAAGQCEEEKARRIKRRADAHLAAARAELRSLTPQQRRLDGQAARLADQIAQVQTLLNAAIGTLQRCGRMRPLYGYTPRSGTMKALDRSMDKRLQPNEVRFRFDLGRRARDCQKICFVSVYHIEEDATDRTLQRPSKGDTRTGRAALSSPPLDIDASKGYVIDAPPTAKTPCWPTSKRTGNVLTVSDRPCFVKRGHTAYFETCVVCLDAPIHILYSIRWSYGLGQQPGPTARINKRHTSRKPSPQFEDALFRWRYRH